jgi:hypothetical protein
MMNQKPTTSLEEDLKTLGLLAGDSTKKSLSEDEQTKEPTDDSDDEADKDEKAKDKADKADKKDDKDDDHKDEKQDKELIKKEVPKFLQAKEQAELERSYTEQLEAAWDVVHFYYKLDESEDKALTTDDLRTVVEAQTFIIEAAYNADEPTTEPKDVPGGNAVDAFPDSEDPTKESGNPAFGGPLGMGKKNAVAGVGYNLAKTGAAKNDKGTAYSPRHRSQPAPTNEASLDSLVSDLKSLQASVVESEPTAEQLAVSQKLIEGFEAVRDTAGSVFQSIDKELSESKNVTEGDARVAARDHFEGIANDAAEILNAIASGQVEIADAASDLNTISDDLKQGLDALNGVA